MVGRHATVEELSELLDQALEGDRLRLVEDHVGECGDCRQRLEGLRRVVADLDRLEAEAPPQHLGRLVNQRIEKLRNERGLVARVEERMERLNEHSALGPVFAVVLALGVIYYLFSFAVAHHQQGTSTRMILGSGRAAAGSPAAGQPIVGERREVGDRIFHWTGTVWSERGLGAEATRREVTASEVDDPELAAWVRQLETLGGPVWFRWGDEVLELR